MPNTTAATIIPIPNATSRIFQLVRCAGIESIRFPFRFDAAQPPFGFNTRGCCGFLLSRREWRFMRSVGNAIVIGSAIFLGIAQAPAGEFDSILHWRNIGPYRGGRTRAICGLPSQPNVFYMAPVNGGVFKSIDYGRTWTPIFDDQPTASVGTIAVSSSNPNVVYVGSGEGLHRPDLSVGDGVYKSTDAGTTWNHLGLSDGQQIPQLAVDPKNPDRVFVAVAGHPYGPNEERGVYRSL